MTNISKAVQERLFEVHFAPMFSSANVTVHEAVYTALHNLVCMPAKVDWHLGGTLVGVGSYFDNTRVEESLNEFDYIYELTEISHTVANSEPYGSMEYRFQTNAGATFTSTNPWLSNILIRERLGTRIDQVMRTISLPANLHHGGILCPCFSGIRKNGPAFTLLFAWSGGHHVESPLLVSVDITVGIRPHHLQVYADKETKLAQLASSFGVNITDAHRLYFIAHPDRKDAWQMTTAALEVTIMSELNKRTVTRIIKTLKVLKNLVLTVTESSNSERRIVETFLRQQES